MARIKPARSPDELTVFVRAAEARGFSAAAKALGLTPSAVSKVIGRLEDRLGVRLLARTTRSVTLTPEGEGFYAHCRRIVQEIAEAEEELARHRSAPRGLLRIDCATTFGQHQLLPALPEFLARYPEIRLDVVLSDQVTDVAKEGLDLAIRLGPVADESLVERPICDMRRTICAAPGYLARHGTPSRPEDLYQHNCLHVAGLPSLRLWTFSGPDGPRTIEIAGNVTVNSGEALLALGLAGVGIVRMADVAVAEPIRRGLLVPLLTDVHRSEAVTLFAAYPQDRRRTPKVHAMLGFLVERFGDAPWKTPAPPHRRRARHA